MAPRRMVINLPSQDVLPLLSADEGGRVHGAAVTDHEHVLVLHAAGQLKEGVFNLDHGLQKIFLKYVFKFRQLKTVNAKLIFT